MDDEPTEAKQEELEEEEAEPLTNQHEAWVKDWQEKFVQVTDVPSLEAAVVFKTVRLTLERGASDDHPADRVVVDGRVVGLGYDKIYSDEADGSYVSCVSLVMENGHAHRLKTGIVLEVKEDHGGFAQLAL